MRRLTLVAAVLASLWFVPGAFAGGWCGTGASTTDRPDAVTGDQVHVVYAVPSDGADNFPAFANRIADDVTSIGNWWTGQDATRTPRFDLAAFPLATCVDISSVRLAEPGASLQGNANAAFARVANDLASSGFGSPYKRYLVYYDGPSVQTNVCGVGGGTFGLGLGYAIVWLAGCPGVPTDAVAVHELVHALGAVPSGAPHECPPPNDQHVCDSPLDLMFWEDRGQPLANRVLDFNHDDYYEHATGGIDIRNSFWLRHLDTPQQPLGVTITGTGTVLSDVPGVDCGTTCTTAWDRGSQVTLNALPAAGTRFVRWTGACAGRAACAVQLDQPTAVTALFGPVRIPLRVTAAGRGRVACTPACPPTFTAGRALTLEAVAAPGWKFVGWRGGCQGTRPVCRPATNFALTVRATFRKR